MQRSQPLSPHLESYNPRARWVRPAFFWLILLFETLKSRRLSRVVRARVGKVRAGQVEGLENLPTTGNFILALNHYRSYSTLDILGVVMLATSQARPDLADRFLLVAGRRSRKSEAQFPLPVRWIRRVVRLAFERWSDNLIQIPLANDSASIKSLREWRKRLQRQSALVFPEGQASLEFKPVRAGSGRWLASTSVPVLPVGVWWYAGKWRVKIGPPIEWASRSDLHDVQLGLVIAELLPSDLISEWQPLLEQWHAVHSQGELEVMRNEW